MTRHMGRWAWMAGAVALVALAASIKPLPAGPAPAPPPDFKYVGTKDCNTANCHGAEKPKGTPGLDEGTIWTAKDKHSKAFTQLYKKDSADIAKKLGIKTAAQSDACTKCHTLIVDKANVVAGKTWSPQGGVSCEVCHGPAEKWLVPHSKTEAVKWEHAESIKHGMTDLRDLSVWAADCVRCHLKIDAALIDAGHPRLNFELVDYNTRMPPHWATAKHPSQQPGFDRKAWAVGQIVSLREAVVGLLERRKAGAPQKALQEAEALVSAYRATAGLLADVSGDPSEELIKKLDGLVGAVAAPGDDFAAKLGGLTPVDFDSARQLALAYRVFKRTPAIDKLCEQIAAEKREGFDLAKFKAELDAARK
jgi:hypothetical protein